MIVSAAPLAVTLTMLAQAGWSATAGVEQFSYRDVSRFGPPADASPVKWEGSGPSFRVIHENEGKRLHRFSMEFASAGEFAYAGPSRTTSAPSADRANRIEGRYEYRMYPFRDLFVRGLDAGVGVEGSARRLSFSRHVAAGAMTSTGLGGGVACVAAMRLHRWSRWTAEVAWTNGLRVVRQHDAYGTATPFDVAIHGGGWQTDLALSASLRIAPRAWLAASWLTADEGNVVTHHNAAFGRNRVLVGVTYAR